MGYWTGFGFDANIVEEYILLAALLHVFVALKRTWDISINYTIASGKLNLAISGITLLTFMCIHLFQFRFGETQPFKLCPPPYLMNIGTIFHLASVVIFTTHMCLGWQKVVPAPSLDIPKRYHQKAIHVGYVMTAFVGLIYASFPLYTHLASMDSGYFGSEMPL